MNKRTITRITICVLSSLFALAAGKCLLDKLYGVNNIPWFALTCLILAAVQNIALAVSSFFIYEEEDVKIHQAEMDNISLRRDKFELERQISALKVNISSLEKQKTAKC